MAASAERLQNVDAELDAFEVDEQRARDAVSAVLASRPTDLADVDAALEALAEGMELPAAAEAFASGDFSTEELSVSDLEVPSEVIVQAAPSVPPPVPSEPAPAAESSVPPPSEPAAAESSVPPLSEPAPEAATDFDPDALFADVAAGEGHLDLDDELGELLDDGPELSLGEAEPDAAGFDDEDATGLFTADDLASIQSPVPAAEAEEDELELLIDDDFDLVIDDGEIVEEAAAGEAPAEESGDDAEKGFFKKLFG